MDQLIVFGAKYLVVFVALGSALVLAFAGERRARLVYTLAIALPLGYALARLAGLALWALALLVGLSRMLAGLHYTVDVVAAAALAVAAVWAADRTLALFWNTK